MRRTVIIALALAFIAVLLTGGGLYFYRFSGLGNVPEVPGANLKYKIVGVQSARFHVEVKYEGQSHYDYDYDYEVGDRLEGLLPLSAPPTDVESTISIKVVSETGRESESLVFTNRDWWRRVGFFGLFRDYAISHTFVIPEPPPPCC